MNVGVIGVGYLGRYHAEKYAALPEVELVGVVDTDPDQGRQVAGRLNTRWFPDAASLYGLVNAVSIVVPTAYHYRTALPFLEQGVHVLLEKPMTVTLEEADGLIAAATRKATLLQIGHIERFNPAVTSIRKLLASPHYITAERAAPFTVRCTDVNVVLDLMIHDLDIVSDLAGSEPRQVCAAGSSIITDGIDAATARIVFGNGCIADVTASRVSPEKKRILRVFDGPQLYTADYQTQKATAARRGMEQTPKLVVSDISGESRDTLNEEIRAFVESVKTGSLPTVSGREGRRALALANLITETISKGITGFVPVP